MRLDALLAGLSERQREELLRCNGWQSGADAARLLAAPDTLNRWAAELYAVERNTLAHAIRSFGCEPFDEAGLLQAGRTVMSGAALRVGLIRLSAKGILFPHSKKYGETVFRLPEETFRFWSSLLVPVDMTKAVRAPHEAMPDSPYRAEAPMQLLTILAYAAKERMTLTQKGAVHKRHAGRIAALTGIPDAELKPEEGQWQPQGSRFGSLAANFLFDAAFRLGLAEERAGRVEVCTLELSRWFADGPRRMSARLYQLWLEAVLPRTVQMYYGMRLVERLAEGEWLLPEALAQSIALAKAGTEGQRRGGKERPDAAGLGRQLEDALERLAAWGWMEVGRSKSGERLYRWLDVPFEEKALSESPDEASSVGSGGMLYVQPDFELIAEPGCAYDVRWELEMIAERIRYEHAAVYRLTRETVMRALFAGRTAESIIGFLRRYARSGVPEGVASAIAEWGERQSLLRMESAVVLRFRDEEAAAVVCKDERVAALLGDALGPAAWLVPQRNAAELSALLTREGYSPGDGDRERSTLLPQAEQGPSPFSGNSGEKGLIYSEAEVKYYDRERIVPLIENVYPGLQQVPAMWLNECRTYHVSTRKQMIQKALDFKACLRLRQSGADMLLIPLRLDGIRDDWAVTGFHERDEVRLAPDQWEEMQLILPGINDESG